MTLEDLRRKIDEIDDKLIRLLNERADLVHEVGELKKKDGLEIYAPEREGALLRSLAEKNSALGGRLPEKSVRAIYREIMSAALALEENLRIAFLGPEGSWTHQAAIEKFGHSVEYAPLPNLRDIFEQVERREADYGVLPIENVTEGALNHMLDIFADSPLKMRAHLEIPVEVVCMSREPREAVRVIYAHPQVLAQCRSWVKREFPAAEVTEVASSNRAAEIVAAKPATAALGTPLAARLHSLDILGRCSVEAPSVTRFVVIGRNACPPTGDDRSMVLMATRAPSRSLVQALKALTERSIDVVHIENRPSLVHPDLQLFLLEVDGHGECEPLRSALDALAEQDAMVRLLGSFPAPVPADS